MKQSDVQPTLPLFFEQGEEVITMAMLGKVKRMFFREKKSVR